MVGTPGQGGLPVGVLTTSGNGAFDIPINVGAGVSIGPSSGDFEEGYISTLFKNHLRSAPDFGPSSFLGFRTGMGQYGYIEVLWTASTNTFKLVSAAYALLCSIETLGRRLSSGCTCAGSRSRQSPSLLGKGTDRDASKSKP